MKMSIEQKEQKINTKSKKAGRSKLPYKTRSLNIRLDVALHELMELNGDDKTKLVHQLLRQHYKEN